MTNTNLPVYPAQACDGLQHFFKEEKINDHILHFMASFAGRLDFINMKEAISAAMTAFPLLRCGYFQDKRHPYWREQNFLAGDLVQLVETDHPDSQVNQFLYQELSETDGPQLRAAIIRSAEHDILCIIVNHMLCDAAGFKELLYLMCSAYSYEGSKENMPGIRPMAAMRNRSIHQVLTSFTGKERLKLRFSKYKIPAQNDSFAFEGDLKHPFIEKRVLNKEFFRALKTYAKAHGATVNDVMLAALHRTVFQTIGKAVPIPCANDLRKYMNSPTNGICNIVTNLCCCIDMESGDSFEDTLMKVNSVMKSEKANIGCAKSLLLLENVFHILPYKAVKPILQKNFSNPFIAFTNIGVLDADRLKFGTSVITEAFMTGSIKYAPYFQLAVCTFHDEATLSINLYGSQSDEKQISDFLDRLILELQNGLNAESTSHPAGTHTVKAPF